MVCKNCNRKVANGSGYVSTGESIIQCTKCKDGLSSGLDSIQSQYRRKK